jgi:hypothetical protein
VGPSLPRREQPDQEQQPTYAARDIRYFPPPPASEASLPRPEWRRRPEASLPQQEESGREFQRRVEASLPRQEQPDQEQQPTYAARDIRYFPPPPASEASLPRPERRRRPEASLPRQEQQRSQRFPPPSRSEASLPRQDGAGRQGDTKGEEEEQLMPADYPDLPELSQEGPPPVTCQFVHLLAQGRSRGVPLSRIQRDLDELGVLASVHPGNHQGKAVALISLEGSRPQQRVVAGSINAVRSLGWYVRLLEAGSTTKQFMIAGETKRPVTHATRHSPRTSRRDAASSRATARTPGRMPSSSGPRPAPTTEQSSNVDQPPTRMSPPPSPEQPTGTASPTPSPGVTQPTASTAPPPNSVAVTVSAVAPGVMQLDFVGRITVGVEDARRALQQSGGDMSRAVHLLANPSSVVLEDMDTE